MTHKLHFTQQDDFKPAKLTSVIGVHQDIVVFRTVEIKSHNPSDLTMVIQRKSSFAGQTITEDIPLVDFRTAFLFQNGAYILDVRALDRFINTDDYYSIRVSFLAINKSDAIDATVYFHLVDKSEYAEYISRLSREQLFA